MAAPDQRVAEVAAARAAAEAAAKRKAAGGPPKPHNHGNVALTAVFVVGLLMLTLAVAVWAGR